MTASALPPGTGIGFKPAHAAALLSDGARSWQVAMAGSVYFLLSFTGLMYALGRRWGLRAQ